MVESGTHLLLGVVDPLAATTRAGSADEVPVSVAAATVAPVRALWHRLGLPVDSLPEVGLTPTCGLAGASPAGARAALAAVREAGRRLSEDPDGDLGEGRR